MLERWIRSVLRRRLLVVGAWAVLLGAGVAATTQVPGLLANGLAVPGTDSERARQLLEERFDERPDGTFVVVFPVARPSDAALRRSLQRRLDRAARTIPVARSSSLRSGGGILYGSIATGLDLQDAKRRTVALRAALATPGGPEALVTGQPALQHDIDPVFATDLRRGEAVAIPITLLVLLAVLGLSLAVLVPLAFALCSVATTLGAVYLVAHAVDTGTYVVNLVELVGLGLAVDYSLLVVARFREELARGDDPREALVRTMLTAGRAVVVSGLAVATGLALLGLVPVPFLRSMGLGGLLVAVVSVAGALTLLPAVLSLLGPRGMRRIAVRGPRTAAPGGADGWTRIARAMMRRPMLVLGVGSVVLVAAAVPAAWLEVAPGSIAELPGRAESLRAFDLLSSGVGQGAVTPTEIVVDAGPPGAARTAPVRAAVDRLVDAIVRDPEVAVVASGRRDPYVDARGRTARIVVTARHDYASAETRALVHRIRDDLVPAARFPAGARVVAGGAPPQSVDFVARAYSAFPWLVAAVLAATAVGLLRAFRSLVLPLKAVALNALSVAAVVGLLVVVFQWGVGAGLLGLERVDAIEAWVPIFLFATLFGVSMDYEVFLVSRMREAWDGGAPNPDAVALGLARSGRIVTAAALVMTAAFSGFVAGRVPGLQQFGLGLVLGVLIDATLVRIVLVPALMAVLGRWNWWLPRGVARLARVEPSPLERPGPS